MKKILIVDDEPTLVATLRYSLERDGFEVISADNGESAVSSARSHRPDLIVLDLMLPGLDGLQVCRTLRREMQVPILMLTAKSEEIDKVLGLELGADDYVTKPFSMREVMARVRALLRRADAPSAGTGLTLTAGAILVDMRKREASREGAPVALKPKEFELLAFLMQNRGQAFTREQLLEKIWGYDFAGDSRTVDVHVSWLRQKIENHPQKPVRIVTVRGLGYRFDG